MHVKSSNFWGTPYLGPQTKKTTIRVPNLLSSHANNPKLATSVSLVFHGWKTKPDLGFGVPNPKTVDEKLPPNQKLLDPKPADIRTKTDPLSSLLISASM
jgi:hypothetical protein